MLLRIRSCLIFYYYHFKLKEIISFSIVIFYIPKLLNVFEPFDLRFIVR